MRQKIAAGNWKMNTTWQEAKDLTHSVMRADRPRDVITILASPFPYLQSLGGILEGEDDNLYLAAQNVHHKSTGAFTGEVSCSMLKSIGVKYVILGHSERREFNGETDLLLYDKLIHVHNSDMLPIFCCGEPLDVRKEGKQNDYVINQLSQNLLKISEDQILKTIVAYEPIWAIGTGETATPDQAQEMHATIRNVISQTFGQGVASQISILYGGSVKGSNAAEIFEKADVDGGLVGGASLISEDFIKIINSFQ